MIAGVVLSGGKSERMGSPKALLEFRGRTFLSTILDAVNSAGLKPVLVVAGHHYDAIVAAFPRARVILNSDYELGMSTSVQAGIRALPAGLAGAAVFLVDHPLIDNQTIAALAERVKPGHIVVPVHNGRRGHPVIFAAELFEEILNLPSSQGLNSVVKRNRDRVVEVEVENPGVLRDIDTPEELAELRRESH